MTEDQIIAIENMGQEFCDVIFWNDQQGANNAFRQFQTIFRAKITSPLMSSVLMKILRDALSPRVLLFTAGMNIGILQDLVNEHGIPLNLCEQDLDASDILGFSDDMSKLLKQYGFNYWELGVSGDYCFIARQQDKEQIQDLAYSLGFINFLCCPMSDDNQDVSPVKSNWEVWLENSKAVREQR